MSISAEDRDYVRELVRKHVKIVIQPDQSYLIQSRLEPLARKLGAVDLPGFISQLRRAPFGESHRMVIDAMTTGETSFFRDIHPFETLKKHVLPELIEKRRSERALRLWSGACSSGQEACSLVILLLENFPEIASWDIKVIGTDVSSTALTKARSGRYNSVEIGRGLSAKLLVKYFDQVDSDFQLKPVVKSHLEWLPLNLTGKWPLLPLFDIVLLRNVLIYFDAPTQNAVLAAVRRVMRRDATLLLGTVESTLGMHVDFEAKVYGKTTVYRPIGSP